ncbi:hypothetical protein [Parasediminibacterium sp. JCM 36343]|uniref:hypothetical protein n=1 Tax=Parasediminibacterium sp. JCM 36343 TaxID=3374279 RepID=UPI00397D9AB3
MIKSVLIIGIVAIGCASIAFAQTISPFADKPADSYSNYTDINGKPGLILWGSLKPNDFGSRNVLLDQTNVRKLRQVPAPGIHPRVYFGPEDLPDIRKNLKETKCGQEAWKNILSWTEMMKGKYDDKDFYAQPDVIKGEFGGLHGKMPLWRLGVPRVKGEEYNHNSLALEYYNKLADGSARSFPPYYWSVFSLEGFRCLIDNDGLAAQKLAKVVVTALKVDVAKRDSLRAANNITKPIEQPVGTYQLAFTYDFIFNWLTPEQKKIIHDELAQTTWSHDNYGTFNTAEGSRSNWASFSNWLFEVLAIEGEPGFNELKVKGMYRGWRNLLNYGWFKSGATYEGEAKNQLGMDGIIAFAKRLKMYGFEDISGHPYLQAYANHFLPHSVIPTQDGLVKYDLLGGSHAKEAGFTSCDLLGLKYMFPNDKKIDWVYRTVVGEDYSNIPVRPDGFGYYNGLLFYAIFATDFDVTNSNPAKLGLGNTFFCGERALMMTRSSWDTKDALMLNMHTRQANGGHPSSDRNAIMLAGAGRVWSPVQGIHAFDNFKQSVVVIDKQPQVEYTPATMVDFKDEAFFTFATGDAKYAWDWNWKEYDYKRGLYTAEDVRGNKIPLPKGWELENHSINYFSYTKLPYAYLNVPKSESPHWIFPDGAIKPVMRQVNYPVKKAFRTAGIIRSSKPYALVVDDISKDENTHHFDWILTLEHDIQIVKIDKANDKEMDILLTGNDPKQLTSFGKDTLEGILEKGAKIPEKQPMLLVRVLNADNAGQPVIQEWRSNIPKSKYGPIRKLIIPADAVSPAYKVLLYPYRNGDELPKTSWDKSHTKLTVKWVNGEAQVIGFVENESGRTVLDIKSKK